MAGVLRLFLQDGGVDFSGERNVAGLAGGFGLCERFGDHLCVIGAAQDAFDEGIDLAFRQRAEETVHRAALVEGIDGRDRAHTELAGIGGMVLGVDLDELDRAFLRLDRLFEDWAKRAAGARTTAPRSHR